MVSVFNSYVSKRYLEADFILYLLLMRIAILLIVFFSSFNLLFMSTYAQTMNLPNQFGVIVYKMNGLYFARDSQSNIIVSSDTPDIVIKTALDRRGDIYITGGAYYLSKDFSGFDLRYSTHLKLAQDTALIVPSGYHGYVFRFNSGIERCVLDGGWIYEANPVKRNWIGIMMQGGSMGVALNYIENVFITNPYIVIDFNATTGEWINANTFVNIKAESFVKGIEFDFKGSHTGGADGFYGNTFRDLQFQSGPMTRYGVKDIKHGYNGFYNVEFWDLPPTAISSNIDPSADNTIIIGGQMTRQGFVDKGMNTIILDAWHTNLLSNSTIISGIIKDSYAPQVNMTIPSHQILNMSINQQSTSNFVKGNQGQLVLSSGQPITVNIYGIVGNQNGGVILLNITRPDGVIEQNEADVTSAGAFYYPMIFDKNSWAGQYKIEGTYQNYDLGSLVLNVISNPVQQNETSQPNIVISPLNDSNGTIYRQIKIDAKLWSQGQIKDDIFINSLQFLVNLDTSEKLNKNQTSSHLSVYIPLFFRNDAGWWADGQISDGDFISGIKYLVQNGIIQISS
jgi:hypothetical protein